MVCKQEGKKMFCLCPLHGKEMRNITLRCGEKKDFQCWNKTGDRIVKQVGEVLKFPNAMSPARRVAQ